jgi:hypothetical protein
MYHKKSFILLVTLFFCKTAEAIFPINITRSWDLHIRPPHWCNARFQVTAWAEHGFFTFAANSDNSLVNPLQIWQSNQDALAMLKGFSADSPMTTLLQTIENLSDNNDTLDNGIRGHILFNGSFNYTAGFGLNARYYLPHNFSLGLYIPAYCMRLHSITFKDMTGAITTSDFAVKTNLTDNFTTNLHQLDPSLNLDGWKKTGIGDIVIMAEWLRNFPQLKPILRNVQLDVRLGIITPSGLGIDVDDILSVPFGSDNSTGIIAGGGIQVNWFDLLNGRAYLEVIQLFGNTRERRIKVAEGQSEFLFLAKVKAHKDFPITQRYNLQLEADHFYKGCSAGLAYEFWKQGESKLSIESLDFSNDIANTAESLQGWTIHQMIIALSYDFYEHICDDSWFKPHLRIYYKYPFNGQRSILSNEFGGVLSFNF